MYNGETHESLEFTDPGVMINVTTTNPLLGECQLKVLAIGGGGYGNGYGGGGSGYIQYLNKTLTASTSISLTVGNYRESSIVNINGETVVIEVVMLGRC